MTTRTALLQKLLMAGMVIAAPSTWAAIRYVDGAATGANNGSSWADAYTTVTTALAAASDNDELWVAQGTYSEGAQLTVNQAGLKIYGGFTNSMASLSQRDTTAFAVKVDGALAYRCFNITAANVTLDGLILQQGRVSGYGAGICNAGSGLTVQNCVITNCVTAPASGDNHAGGGIYSSESIQVRDSLIANNRASSSGNGYGGGGIYFNSTGSLTVSNTVFQGNIAKDENAGDPSYGAGGAIQMAQSGQLTAFNCVFDSNAVLHDEVDKEHRGGAIYLKGNSGAGRIVNCTFYTNNVVRGFGGAIYSAGAPLSITNAIFWGNTRGYRTTGKQIYSTGSIAIHYACLPGTGTDEVYAGGTLTLSNVITNDPLFVSGPGHDLHLKSRGGHYTASGWVKDAVNSPCLDAGDPASAFANEPAYNGGRINLGAYGNTPQASKTPADTAISNGSVTYVPGQTVATLNGMLTYTGAAPAQVWVYWGKVDGGNNETGLWANTNAFGVNTAPLPATYSTNVTVELNTTYYYAFMSANAYGTNWATPSASFFTVGVPPKMTVEASDAAAAELGADPGTFTISGDDNMLPDLPLTVYYTISGTAVNGTDYTTIPSSVTIPAGSRSATITVTPRYDTSVEGAETVTLTLVSDPLYTFDAPAAATVTLADNPSAGVIVYVDKDVAGGAGDGTSWANACTNFTVALAYVAEGGAVWAANGTYTEAAPLAITTPNISVYGGFSGSETLLSQRDITANPTVLSGENARRLLAISSTNVTLDGLTLTQGRASSGMGAAIANTGSGLIVRNCILRNNELRTSDGNDGGTAIGSSVSLTVKDCLFFANTNTVNSFGGAIYLTGGTLLVERTDFILNHNADSYSGTYGNGCGGALHIRGGTLTARNCSFVGNTTDAAGGNLRGSHGGAIYFGSAAASSLENCTFYANRSLRPDAICGGGALYVYNGSAVVGITNCIFWQNVSASSASSAHIQNSGTINLGYCDIDTAGVSGGTLNYGAGMVNVDPLFASTSLPYDMHLKSKYGRWSAGGWVNDAVTSPCIDAGDPASSFSLESDYNGERINLGAYGNTAQASRSKRTGGTVISFH